MEYKRAEITIWHLIAFTCILGLSISWSVVGIRYSALLYSSEASRLAFLPNDYVNLIVCIPLVLLVIIGKNSLAGYTGMLFVLYNSIAYAIALGSAFQYALVFLTLIALYATLRFSSQNLPDEILGQRLALALVPLVMGTLFGGRALVVLFSGTASASEIGTAVADILAGIFWIVSGLLAMGRQTKAALYIILSYFLGAILFLALLVYFCLQPFVCGSVFPLSDFLFISVMSLLFLIPATNFLVRLVHA